MLNVTADAPDIMKNTECAHSDAEKLWAIVTGLTRLYFTYPDLGLLKEAIGEEDFQHLLRINEKLKSIS